MPSRPGELGCSSRQGFANFNPHAVTKVDFHKDDRPPLLVIGNSKDHTVPASVSRAAAKLLGRSRAVVDYKEYAGGPHFTAGANFENSDALAFNQWRVTSDHRPLGEIINVRRIYSASAKVRRTLNHQSQTEPTSADSVLP